MDETVRSAIRELIYKALLEQDAATYNGRNNNTSGLADVTTDDVIRMVEVMW